MPTQVAGPEIERLIQLLARLPGLGPRSARRAALHLIRKREQLLGPLAEAMRVAHERVTVCSVCGSVDTRDPCTLCADERRDAGSICVVERPVDIFSLEKAGVFHGKYHVLGGKISPLNGVEPEDLRIAALESRLDGGVKEIILALSTDVEGDATSFYLAKRLAGRGAKISRLAYGLPAGSGLEFADEITLGRALEGRRDLS